jgi:hypothetical protein
MKALHRQQGAKHRKPALGEDGRCANCHILQPGTILFKKKKKVTNRPQSISLLTWNFFHITNLLLKIAKALVTMQYFLMLRDQPSAYLAHRSWAINNTYWMNGGRKQTGK